MIIKKKLMQDLINIGAVFDYYSGYFNRPFKVIRNLGFEWLFRIFQNPKLWRRTLYSLPIYIFYIIKQIAKTDLYLLLQK